MKILAIMAAVAAAFGFGASTAFATEATTSVNVRSGPGTGYSVVDVLYAGEEVNVEGCRSSGWCLISHSGPDGYVFSRYLAGDDDSFDDDEDDTSVSTRPDIRFFIRFGTVFPRNGMGGPRSSRDLVCLVTFFNRSQVEAGADANVQSARVMSRAQAEAIDGPNDRRAIFDYGTNQQTRDTCEYLDNLN
jgi:uncharacterized protein YgiM (DUF1202 family)